MNFSTIISLIALTLTAHAVTYEELRPLLKDSCLNCHNPDKKKADLDLSTYEGVLAGGSSGEVVKAGVPDSSPLYLSVIHHDDWEAMPPKKAKLSGEKLALFRDWITHGLIESTGGSSKLRKIPFEIPAGSANKPDGLPPMPLSKLAAPAASKIHPPSVTAMAASPWAPLVALSGNEEVLLLNTETEDWLGALPFPEGTIHAIKFSRDGSLLLAAGGRGAHSGKVIIFDVKTGQRVAEIGDEQDSVLAADLSADHQFVALGGPGKIVKIFELKTGKQLHRIKKHTDWITSISFAPTGHQLATADRNGGIHVWEGDSGAIIYSLSEHSMRVSALDWRADGRMLASASDDGKFILWDMQDGWPAKVVDAHVRNSESRYTRKKGILDLRWSRQGGILTVGRDHKLRIWKADGSHDTDLPEVDPLVTKGLLIAGGTTILSGSLEGSLILLSREQNKTSVTTRLP
ncbi:c-type cytochrome domain-containing protein [Verrucomicrobiaceae bacterium 227]